MMPQRKNRLMHVVLSIISACVLFSNQAIFATENPATEAVPTATTVQPTTASPTEEATSPTSQPQTNEATQEGATSEQPAPNAPTTEQNEPQELAAPVAQPAPAPVADPAVDVPVTIIHTNDIHGRLEAGKSVIGVAKLATIVNEERTANPVTLVLDAGDAFQGLPISNNSKGAAMAAIMNAIGYDAMAVGNHEFDFGFNEVVGYKDVLNFPLLSTNVYKDGARVFEPYTLITKNGVQFAVIGVTTPETATKTHPNNVIGVTFGDPIPEVEKVITEIQAANPTITNYIVLAHLGIDETTQENWRGSTLAEALSNHQLLKDKQVIVIDGHSHTNMNAQYGHVVYNQTGSYLANIGKITYTNGKNDYTAGVIPAGNLANTPADPVVAALVQTAKNEFDTQNAITVIPNNPIELNGDRSNVRVRETNLGNLVTDAIYQYGQTGFATPTDIAVTNGGGIRATLQKDAPITKGDIISVLPFGNIVSQIQVTGSQIQEMFAFSLRADIQKDDNNMAVVDENGLPLLTANGGFLHASGVKVYYDVTKDPAERVLAIKVFNRNTNTYEPLDPSKTYYLATNDFLAAGGDGYTMLHGARQEGPSLDTVLANFIPTVNLATYTTIAPNSRLISLDASIDSDQDGYTNAEELAAGFDPFDATSHPTKTMPSDPANTNQQPTTPATTETPKQTTTQVAVKPATTSMNNKALPNTGTSTTYVWTLVGGALVCVGVMMLKRKTNV